MRLTTFQPPELRDENNNIVQSGTYGKHTAFTNPQNSGAFDYINNNLQALNDRQNDIDDSKANVGDSYTKAEADTLLDAKANQDTTYTKTEVDSIAGGKLNLSGGALTGNEIRRNVDNENIIIRGCTANAKGSRLVMYGQDATYAGEFDLQAFKEGVGSHSLHGRPNGTLIWDDNDLAGSAIVSSGTNYIRYASGLQICWDKVNLNNVTFTASGSSYVAKVNQIINFGQAFANAPAITATTANDTDYVFSSVLAIIRGVSSITQVNLVRPSSSSGGSITLQYIAIGKWK